MAFIPGEYQKGIHTVDFLIWIPDYNGSRFGDRSRQMPKVYLALIPEYEQL
ncbi:MAG: hypothetical protein OXM61_07710 [Candidatus Poribacteria bacterium]|nr:hypothetical protein [Candidatus Poribacteria bacterium]